MTPRALAFLILLALTAPLGALEIPRAPSETNRRRSLLEPARAQATAQPPKSQPAPPFHHNPAGAGLLVTGLDQPLTRFSTLTVAFPAPMTDKLGPEAASPILVDPPLEAEFAWRSPSVGEWKPAGPIRPATTYRLRLRPDLKTLAGEEFAAGSWGAEWRSPELALEWHPRAAPRARLPAQPQVWLSWNYPVDLASVPEGVNFRIRDTGERLPAEVFLNEPAGAVGETRSASSGAPCSALAFRVQPARPLPAGGRVDLVIGGIREAHSGLGLPYPEVIPLGETKPLEIERVEARWRPLEKPALAIVFTERLAAEPLPDDAVRVQPSAGPLRMRVEGAEVVVEGDFRPGVSYRVEIPPQIRGEFGFGLAQKEVWNATFRERRPAILFPDGELRMRSRAGLRFPFYQVACGPARWKAFRIAPTALPHIRASLREHENRPRDAAGRLLWTKDGYLEQGPVKPMEGHPGLELLAEGEFPEASGEELREIEWKGPGLEGPVLIEVQAPAAGGRVAGQRGIVYFSELAVVRKEARGLDFLRVVGLADGLPQPGAHIRLYDALGRELGQARTDREGLAKWDPALFAACEFIAVKKEGRESWQPRDLAAPFDSGPSDSASAPSLRGFTWTDRSLYRPGHVIHFRGFVRDARSGELRVPAGLPVRWTISRWDSPEPAAEGDANVNREGAWGGKWQIPPSFSPGEYNLRVAAGGAEIGRPAYFRIEEYRPLPFSVECQPLEQTAPAVAALEVISTLFHGAPHRGARVRWRAIWHDASAELAWEESQGGEPLWRTDRFSQQAQEPEEPVVEDEGEAFLNEEGRVRIESASPWPSEKSLSASHVQWLVDVTGLDGQTVSAGADARVLMRAVLPGAMLVRAEKGTLEFAWDVLEAYGQAPPMAAELFRVETRSIKERIAPGVYRFDNTEVFRGVEKRPLEKPGRIRFDGLQAGRYVLLLAPSQASGQPRTSTEAWLPGPGEAPLPMHAETQLELLPAGAGPDGRAVWHTGETASLEVRAPSPGVAWVAIEAGGILQSWTQKLDGNLARIEFPVLADYEPNAFATVHLLRPGGAESLAGESFGMAAFEARQPGRWLQVAVKPARSRVEPKSEISGVVDVRAEGAPVADADVVIYALDDAAVQAAGDWQRPQDFLEAFFPERGHGVRTFSALQGMVQGVPPSKLTAKGYLVGDGGFPAPRAVKLERADFSPLILWQTGVKTGRDGQATFSCKASDALTRFRIVAVAQTRENQFGSGEAVVESAKALTIEPALPRFLRAGDQAVLRAVARQQAGEKTQAWVAVEAAENGREPFQHRQEVGLEGGTPTLVSFPIQAGNAPGTISLRLLVQTKDAEDFVSAELPVLPAAGQAREALSGEWSGAFELPPWPASWQQPGSEILLSLSTSPWLPSLEALPRLLEYPHGCTEQISARLLALARLRQLMAAVPMPGWDEENVRATMRTAAAKLGDSWLPGGWLPMWPGSDEPALFPTIQGAWSVLEAEKAGIDLPPSLADSMRQKLEDIAAGRSEGSLPTLRALALCSLALLHPEPRLLAMAKDIFLLRDAMEMDGHLWLAIAFRELEPSAPETAELLAGVPARGSEFLPTTFGSPIRTFALQWLASGQTEPPPSLLEMISSTLSTQESLWFLLALARAVDRASAPPLPADLIEDQPVARSRDGTAAAWKWPFQLRTEISHSLHGSWLARATIPLPPGSPAASQGMRLERMMVNLTHPDRDGSPSRPLKVGDHVLIAYQMFSEKPRAYTALEEPLPAALEALHPSARPSAAAKAHQNPLHPSHTELRDATARLYFNSLPLGASHTSLYARATCAGAFHWPAATLEPMYDARVFARTNSQILHVEP